MRKKQLSRAAQIFIHTTVVVVNVSEMVAAVQAGKWDPIAERHIRNTKFFLLLQFVLLIIDVLAPEAPASLRKPTNLCYAMLFILP